MKKYSIRTENKRYEISIKEVREEMYFSIKDKTRIEIRKAMDRINKKLVSVLNIKEGNEKDYCFIIKQEKK